MAEEYKSVLNKYNNNLKPRLLTAEEEAIEPVYPEEYLIGGPGKAVASGLRSSAEKAAAQAASRQRMAQTKIGSRVPSPEAMAADKAVAEEFAKTKWGKATYDNLRNKAEQAEQVRNKQKILQVTDRSADRAINNIAGETGYDLGGRFNELEEKRNAAGDTYKKGGKIKSTASSRGDGIAKRGKTKGRMI